MALDLPPEDSKKENVNQPKFDELTKNLLQTALSILGKNAQRAQKMNIMDFLKKQSIMTKHLDNGQDNRRQMKDCTIWICV